MINDVIRQLPKELALQIAAGEVVERPASIVKELVENSLDAGAKNIDIKVQGGGINLIEVLDDGRGIRREELKLSLATHSTSKISTADDLAAITTMGFRGEALASIAAVAKLSISSKHRQEEDAWAIDAAGGKIGDLRPAAQASGTRVQVKDIFYNLPARRKFLRTLATEFHNIEQIFIRLALGNHHISFSLTRDDKIIYKLIARSPASKSEGERQVEGQIEGRGEIEGQVEGEADAYIDVRRIEELINEKVSENFVEVDDDAMGYRLRGWTVSPTYASSRNANQFLYVNGRFVRDKIFSNAVKRGYKERLHGQRTPAYVFYLDLPPTEVDVNVHPAKYEVRFHKGQQIHSLVRKAISKAISKGGDPSKLNHGTYKMNLRTTDAADRSITSQDHLSSSYSAKGELSKGELSKGELSNRGASSLLDNNTKSNLSPEDHTSSSYSQSNLHPDPIKDFNKVREALSSFQETDKIPTKSSGQASLSTMAEFMPALGYAVAQLHGIYIISINSAGLVVVDMHAAHERVVFESLKDQRNRNRIEQQQFLLPLTLDILPSDVDFVEENVEKFAKWGLQLRVMGIEQVAVDSMPIELDKGNVTEMVQRLCADFREYSPTGENVDKEINEKILSTMACYGSVRANRNMTIMEMNNLLRKLEKTPSGHLCNHGRPTWFQIDREEIDKKLLRGQ